MIIDKAQAIKALRPNASFALINEELVWNNTEQTQPTETEINNKISELQAEYDAKQYQRDREKEYLSKLGNWQDQLDMIYHDIDNWKSEVKKIKDENPKE